MRIWTSSICATLFTVALPVALSACATAPQSGSQGARIQMQGSQTGAQQTTTNSTGGTRTLSDQTRTATDTAVTATRDGFQDAAMTPLEDLNLRRESIPGLLRTINTPYDPVVADDCGDIAFLVRELDTVLSLDWDVIIEQQSDPDRATQAGEFAGDTVLDTVASEAGGIIPFRGLVRQATGATAHQKRVQRAYQMGHQRRSFLKGIGLARGCSFPAAPADIDPTLGLIPIQFKGDAPE